MSKIATVRDTTYNAYILCDAAISLLREYIMGNTWPATKMAFGAGEVISKVPEIDGTEPRTAEANASTIET